MTPDRRPMIELRTLGSLDLRGRDGNELRPVLSQPKRAALLAYLAAAVPWGFHQRDTLLALFWPELDTEHARGALRNALYFLRRELGDGVVEARGDEVGLDDAALSCDARAFEAALDSGEEERALALYRGAFLEGFHVSDAPEFDRWLEEKRTRLRRRATDAAWALAVKAEAAGNAVGAAGWARRAVALAPYDEARCRQLIELLGKLGDRAGAVREYELFVRRLAQDFDLEPSPQTRALVETIRGAAKPSAARTPPGSGDGGAAVEAAPQSLAGSTTRETTILGRRRFVPAAVALLIALSLGGGLALWSLRPPPIPPPGSASRIAVFPFSYRGSEEFAYLGEGMADLLGASLDSAGELRTADPQAVLGQVAQAGGDVPEPAEAGRLAARLDAGLYVLGSVVEATGRLRISARLYSGDAKQGSPTHVTVDGDPARLLELVDDLSVQLLAETGTGANQRLMALAGRTTESLPALKAYLEGEQEYRAGRLPAAADAFRRAIEADTSFALAYQRLAMVTVGGDDYGNLAREALKRARRQLHRLREPDRRVVEAWVAFSDGRHAEAERLLREVTRWYPDHVEAWHSLANVIWIRGMFLGRSWVDARDAFERAFQLAPYEQILDKILSIAARQGRPADVDSLTERYLLIDMPAEWRSRVRVQQAVVHGDSAALDRFLDELRQAGDAEARGAAGLLTWTTGNIPAGRRLWRLITDPSRAHEHRVMAHMTLAKLEVTAGRWQAAKAELDVLQRLDRVAGLEHRALFALTRFLQVPRPELEAIRDSLLRWDADVEASDVVDPMASHQYHFAGLAALHAPVHPYLRLYLLGLLSVRLDEDPTALRYAGELERRADEFGVPSFVTDLARAVRMEAAWDRGRREEALEILEGSRFWTELPLDAGDSPFLSHAYQRFGRPELLYELGRYDEARRWYDALAGKLYYEGAISHFRLGGIYERLGEREKAADHYARFVELWKDCDPELRPLLKTGEGRLVALGVAE